MSEFDPREEYRDVVRKVEGVVDRGQLKIYRVTKGETRAEYYLVGLRGGRVLGIRTEAVES